MGGYSVSSDLDLGKKVGNLDFQDGGVSKFEVTEYPPILKIQISNFFS